MTPKLRLLALVAVVALAGLAVAGAVPHSPADLRALVAGYGVIAPLAFVLFWIAVTPALFSGTLLAAASGLCFGTALGTPVSIVGATAGGMLAFALGRRAGHAPVQELSGPRLTRLQERIERHGFLSVFVARIAPGVPTTMLNYAGGLSRVRLRDFTLGTALGGAPRIFAYTALGGSAGDLTSAPALVAIGLLAGMTAVALAVAVRARRRLRRLAAAAA